jgi:hypothetical protein
MSAPIQIARLKAEVQVLAAGGWPGIREGFRSSVVLGGDYHTSQVMECDGTIAPGSSGLIVLEVLTASPDQLTVGAAFELTSGATIGARGVLKEIESVRPAGV